MEQKKSKYDTNPLDPEVGRRTEDVWGEGRPTGERVAETEDMTGATREISRTPQAAPREDVNTEAPTRRYDGSLKPNGHLYSRAWTRCSRRSPTRRDGACSTSCSSRTGRR